MTAPFCRSGKHVHPSEGAAAAHLRAILRIKPGYSGRTYCCHVCRGWHVGRRKVTGHVNKYALGGM